MCNETSNLLSYFYNFRTAERMLFTALTVVNIKFWDLHEVASILCFWENETIATKL